MIERTTWSELLHPEKATVFFDRSPLPAFNPEATSYLPENAYWLAELSRVVYRDFVDQPSHEVLAGVGLRLAATFDSERTDTQGFLVTSESPLFAALVFRGTQQKLKDFLSDAACAMTTEAADGSATHCGFSDALQSVWPEVTAALDALPNGCPLFYSGHSLGAALATLAAVERPPRAAYVFGSPRVGNAAFGARLNALSVYRVVDGSDVVTMVPPEEFGFRHAGDLHSVGTEMQSFRFGSFSELRALLVSAFLSISHPPQFLADHAPINYVRRV